MVRFLFHFVLFKVAGGNGAGSTNDKLSSPWGVYVDVNASVYVVDRGNHRVQKWDLGKDHRTIKLKSNSRFVGGSFGNLVAGSPNDPGSWSYQLNNPTAITMDQNGFIYILDYSNSRIQKWYPGASYGSTVVSGTMNLPIGMKFDRLGNVIVADTSNHRATSYALVCRKYSSFCFSFSISNPFIGNSSSNNNNNITTL